MKKYNWELNGKKNYKIEIVNAAKIKINEEEIELKKLEHKNLLFVIAEYKLPLEEKDVLLSIQNGKYHLIVDNKYYNIDKEYVGIEDIPKWIYLFIIINMINFLNGAFGICLAFLSLGLILKICTEKMNKLGKFLLCLMVTITSLLIIFLIVVFLNKTLY